MAGQNERRNFVRRADNPEGHGVKWELSVGDLVHLQARPFIKTYKTLCGTSPSEWRFEMSLPEVREDGTCSLSVLLERTDSLDLELEGYIWIDICDTKFNLIFQKQTFSTPGLLLPGDSIRELVEMTPFPNMGDAIHTNPKVCITLMISFCHSDDESSE